MASCWWGRRCQEATARSIGCGVPGVYPAWSSAGHPSFKSSCLRVPRAHGATRKLVSSRRDSNSGAIHPPPAKPNPLGMAIKGKPPVAGDCSPHIHRHRGWNGELCVVLQRGKHAVGIVPARTRVPYPEPGNSVGVNVLGSPLELGEDREPVAGIRGERVRYLEEHSAVALHNEWAIRHKGRFYGSRGAGVECYCACPVVGRTAIIAESGRVRSMSDRASRARSRPLLTLAGASRYSEEPSDSRTVTMSVDFVFAAASRVRASQSSSVLSESRFVASRSSSASIGSACVVAVGGGIRAIRRCSRRWTPPDAFATTTG